MVDNVYVESDEPLRGRLIESGVELLDEAGMAAVTLRAITRRAGVSHGAPRRYFPTHNALLATIAATGVVDLNARLAPCFDAREASAPDRLRLLGLQYLAFAQERPEMFTLMFRHDLLDGAGADLRSTTVPMFAAFAAVVAQVRGADSQRQAVALWANVHGIAVLATNRSLELAAGTTDFGALIEHSVALHLA